MRNAFAFTAALFLTLFAAAALADRTTTTLAAPAVITRLEFYPPGDGGVMPATACGKSKYSDGGWTPVTCWDVPNGGLAPANGINVSVKALADGAALTFWRGQENL